MQDQVCKAELYEIKNRSSSVISHHCIIAFHTHTRSVDIKVTFSRDHEGLARRETEKKVGRSSSLEDVSSLK